MILIDQGDPHVAVARNLSQQNLPNGVRHLSDSIIERVMQTKKPLIVSDAEVGEAMDMLERACTKLARAQEPAKQGATG